jgi:hypothetical protein
MSKSALLAKADAEFNRLFGEHNPIPYPRTSLDTCQGHLGGAAYVDPVVHPCCAVSHEQRETHHGDLARQPTEPKSSTTGACDAP